MHVGSVCKPFIVEPYDAMNYTIFEVQYTHFEIDLQYLG
jgi:hypothetical protein